MEEHRSWMKLLLVDGNALVHRAFHAFPPLTFQDQPVQAVYGFARMMLTAFSELKPDYVVVAFDVEGKTFRHEAFAEYKAQRVAAPQSLYDQIPLVKTLVEAFGFPAMGVTGFEADDVIATLVRQATARGLRALVMTGDKDTYQLVSPLVTVCAPRNGGGGLERIGPEEVEKRLGVSPPQVADWKALAGDPSDNIPGVPGIGPKTAARLLQTFPNIEQLLRSAQSHDPRIPPKVATRLERDQKNVRAALALVELCSNVPVTLELGKSRAAGALSRPELHQFFTKLHFQSLLKLLPPERSTMQQPLFQR